MKGKMILVQAALICILSQVCAFQPRMQIRKSLSTQLGMGKKLKNKQADLAGKMASAKKKAAENQGLDQNTETAKEKLTDKEMQERNDRLRFEELLKQQPASMNDVASDGYLNKQQEEAEINAMRQGVDVLFEGDPAPSTPFEDIVSVESDNTLGEIGVKRIIPWLRNKNQSEYLIVICDPRAKSPDLRNAINTLSNELPKNLLSRIIIINADTPAENRRFLKKANISESIQAFSDEKRNWMDAYSALGQDRWSMTMFIIADERVQKLARDFDPLLATKTIQNAVKAMESRRL